MDPITFFVIIAVVSVLIVGVSSDFLVGAITRFAKTLGISEYVIGFLVISIGTSLPELIASLNAAVLGNSELVLGTVIGSNIFKIPLLGLVIIVSKKIKTHAADIGSAPIVTLLISVLPLLLIIDGALTRVDGVILLLSFVLYSMNLWNAHGKIHAPKKSVPFKELVRPMFVFLGCLVALLLSARFLVHALVELSDLMKISAFLVGLLVVGIGASAPELIVQLRSVMQKHHNLAFGNVLGSIVANATLVLGIVALWYPFSIPFSTVVVALVFLAVGLFFVLWLMMQKEVTWKHGIILLLIYLVYFIVEIIL